MPVLFFFFKFFFFPLCDIGNEKMELKLAWGNHLDRMNGKKNCFPRTLLGSSLRPPCNKRQINRKKNKQKFNIMYTFCIHGRYPGKLSNPHKWPNHLKYHLQLKSKEDVGAGGGTVMGGDEEKPSKQGQGCYADLSPCLLHWWVSRDLEHLPLSFRDPFKWRILIYVNVSLLLCSN